MKVAWLSSNIYAALFQPRCVDGLVIALAALLNSLIIFDLIEKWYARKRMSFDGYLSTCQRRNLTMLRGVSELVSK